MKAVIQKWGNSLAVRIPKVFAEDAHIENGTEVEISREGTSIRLKKVQRTAPTLDELVSAITETNRHAEVDFGSAEGAEAW